MDSGVVGRAEQELLFDELIEESRHHFRGKDGRLLLYGHAGETLELPEGYGATGNLQDHSRLRRNILRAAE